MRYRRNAATVVVGTVHTLVAGPRAVSKWLSLYAWLLSPSRVRQRKF